MKKAIIVMNELKREGLIKDYAIGGAIGALKWVEPFFTRDLDIFIILIKEPENGEVIMLSPLYEYLKKRGYNKWVEQWIIIDDVPVELIPAEGVSKESVENALEVEFEGIRTKVMRPEYLIALFLKAGRDKDIRKIEMLLKQTKIDMEKLKDILRRYDLLKKFKRFMKEGQNGR
ncbi:MAG: hypothetical protein KAX20_01560 [Candidatus Omnitrophica bacterium]|nr:hypothetical protein [Candidatus Omnitrophota bacterium]